MTMAQFGAARIADIAEVKGGKRLPANANLVSTPTAHAYIRGRDIRDGKITLDDPMYVLDEDFEKIRRYTVDSGDVCITIVGNIGDVGITPPHLHRASLTENAVKLVNLREGIDARFLMYALLAPDAQSQMKLSAAGAAQPKLGIYKVNEIKVPLPSLSVQRRIAGILSAYDKLIENSQRRIRISETMARALYREWFVHFRFPWHENHPRVASPLGEIPEGWEVRTVEEIVRRIPVGKKYDQKTVNPTGTVPVFDQGKSGIIGYHDDEPGVVASETAPVIVFANHTCYQRLVHIPFSAIQNVLPFVLAPALPRNIYWLHWATNGLVVFNDYKGHWPEFAAKSLVVPPAELCQRFGEFVAPLSRQTLKLERQIQNLRRTRDLLLPRLLSGQIDVEAA